MGIRSVFRRWQTKRRVEKQVEALMKHIQEQLDAGVHPSDMLVYEIDKAIEWDRGLQSWKIYFPLEDVPLEVGELVFLMRGRGDAKEHARVVEALDGSWYTVRFDVENRS